MKYFLPLLLTLLFFCHTAAALEPSETLTDPTLEARARQISTQLRCPVCQSESIDDSAADLAKDLRQLVRQRIMAGDTDTQVIDYIHDRYGDFVLLNPPLRQTTFFLWIGPFLLLFGALWLTRDLFLPEKRKKK